MKERSTGLPVSKSYSWKAPEESYKGVEAAIAASALSTPGVQQKSCNSCGGIDTIDIG